MLAALLASGLSDRDVAEQLVITEGTVGVHAEHIFRKLGVRSRMQLAALLNGAGHHAGAFISAKI